MKSESLEVWKRSCRVSADIYKYFAESKDFGFKDQITRSSLSVASNIAEGMEKDSYKDRARFVNISEGSLSELVTQIYIGIEIGYIDKAIGLAWKDELYEIFRMLRALKKNILKEVNGR
ncbi:four helix bundle family protein [Francisella philomiragia]|uniref:four helix bundle protein n=1 Tax=Francisella philomiragia TaxID=28110 RepID=UPI0005A57201|nr:four helix bundle protein [Francisella philomiragia]AJI57962.1 four helix bundle family protein [Francisella philomiragia]